MKLSILAAVVGSAAAFTPPSMTFAVGKKAPPKAAAKTVAVKKAAPAPAKAAVTKAVAKPAPAKPVAKAAPAKPVAKAAPAKPVAKAAPVKAVAKPAPKPAPKPVVKAVVKPAPKPKPVVKKATAPIPKPVKKTVSRSSGTVPSVAIPGENAPGLLDGSLVGDVGFDPCYLSTKADLVSNYFNGILGGKANLDGLTWYRESELIHGRICMVAVLGFIAPGFGTISGNDWSNSFGYTNPLEALSKAPSASLFQIFAFMSILEFRRINFIQQDGSSYVAGDAQKWGQGEGRWNPFNLNYTPEEYKEKQLQELKNGRLAMIGFLGVVFQANASGVSVVDQLSSALVAPEYYAKAGYFLPEGI